MLCIYCQKNEADTVDHVPPKNLFGRPRPSNLIKVPSCSLCNNGYSKDDEYFRAKLSVREGASAAAIELLPQVYRGLAREESKGFRTAYLQDYFSTLRTRSGLIIPRSGYRVSLPRIYRVVERVVRGLYFHFQSVIVPLEHKVVIAVIPDALVDMPDQERLELMRVVRKYLYGKKPILKGNEIFEFRYHIDTGTTQYRN